MQSRPTFFVKRSDRLIARLRHMLHALRFSKQVGGQVIFTWTPLPEWFQQFDSREYHVNTIFDIREHYARGGAHDLIFFDSISPFPKDLYSLESKDFYDQYPSKFDRQFFLSERPIVYGGKYVYLQFSDECKSREQLDQEVRVLYAEMPLDPVVKRILEVSKQKIGKERYSALHIRKGDVGEMMRRDLPMFADGTLGQKEMNLTLGHYLGRTAPFDFYYPHLEECIKRGERILFTSDSPETFDHFSAKFGAKHFVDINKFVRARYPLQKAFLDFNMLMGAERIISTGSTYAAFASELGGGQLINVATGAQIERLAEFAIKEYAPALESSPLLREKLSKEIEIQLRAKGRLAKI